MLGAFDIGGKENEYKLPANPSVWDRVWQNIETTVHITHPEHFIVVQVQACDPAGDAARSASRRRRSSTRRSR